MDEFLVILPFRASSGPGGPAYWVALPSPSSALATRHKLISSRPTTCSIESVDVLLGKFEWLGGMLRSVSTRRHEPCLAYLAEHLTHLPGVFAEPPGWRQKQSPQQLRREAKGIYKAENRAHPLIITSQRPRPSVRLSSTNTCFRGAAHRQHARVVAPPNHSVGSDHCA